MEVYCANTLLNTLYVYLLLFDYSVCKSAPNVSVSPPSWLNPVHSMNGYPEAQAKEKVWRGKRRRRRREKLKRRRG